MKKRIWFVSLAFCFLTGCATEADPDAGRTVQREAGDVMEADVDTTGEPGNILEADKNVLETESGQDAGRQDDAQQGETQQSDEWGLTLRAQDVTAKGCTIVYEQHGGAPSGSELLTGSWYRIEKKEQDEWVEMPYAEGIGEGVGWNDVAWVISMEGSVEFEENWSTLYGELPPGTYRIVKEIMNFRSTGDYDENEYYAEFTL